MRYSMIFTSCQKMTIKTTATKIMVNFLILLIAYNENRMKRMLRSSHYLDDKVSRWNWATV